MFVTDRTIENAHNLILLLCYHIIIIIRRNRALNSIGCRTGPGRGRSAVAVERSRLQRFKSPIPSSSACTGESRPDNRRMNAKIAIMWNLIAVAAACSNPARCRPTAELTTGAIEGRVLTSRDGRPYHSYTGVPYAKPPVGELRFQAPEPVDPWNGTLDATKESNVCIQAAGFPGGLEDCLYLNVYAPVTGRNESLPVMFWIHGGGFTTGHGGSEMFGPDYFMDKDVVLVTVNYRLGMLGFLSTEDHVIPGNFGMKDQVMALRWVRENAAAFGGDRDRVTIFGGSAGAASAGFHLLSPMSRGLFHKAVLQSGAPVCKWAFYPEGIGRKRAHAVATVAGCNFDTSDDLLKCLRRLPVEYLMGVHTKMHLWLDQPFVLFKPVVEDCTSGREAFLCHHPIYDFKQESFVPVVFGLNAAEGGLYVSFLYNETSPVHREFKSHFNYLFSLIIGYNYFTEPERVDEIGEKVLKKYFPSGGIADNTHTEAVKMFTDSLFSQCAVDMAYRLSSPVYGYYYDYQNEFSYNKVFGACQKPLGVTHGDELNSLFRMTGLNPKNLNENDLEVSRLLLGVWYKFVTSDVPTVDGRENGLAWPKFDRSNQLMLHVNSSRPGLIRNPFADAYEFWNELPIFRNRDRL